MSQRKKELRKWLIDHPISAETLEAAALKLDLPSVTIRAYLSQVSMPKKVYDEYVSLGVPAALMPRPTLPKAAIIAENKELKRRLAQYESEFKLPEARM